MGVHGLQYAAPAVMCDDTLALTRATTATRIGSHLIITMYTAAPSTNSAVQPCKCAGIGVGVYHAKYTSHSCQFHRYWSCGLQFTRRE